jgi:hypothetical protein
MKKIAEILNQLKLVIKGKTIDALLPAISFALASNFMDIIKASVLAIVISIGLLIRRILLKNSIKYSFWGLVIVLVAAAFALISGKAENYYLPSVISNFSIFIISIISIIIKKPLAAISSHLTRGWIFKWYERDDVYPAYKEVTVIWSIFFLIRFLIQLRFYLIGDIVQIGILNLMLSLPFTIIVLVISYIYGIWRLNNLSGPSVEEYEKNIDPPWEGQKLGF